MSNNGQPSWGKIAEVDVATIPSSVGSKYFTLCNELRLRLEVTAGGKALAVPFEDERTSAGAMASLKKYFAQNELKVTVVRRKLGDEFFVYVWNDPKRKASNGRRNGHEDPTAEPVADLESGT